MKPLVASWKFARGFVHALAGLWTIVVVFPRLAPPAREAKVQAWAHRMLEVIGIGLDLRGAPPSDGPVLLVANHISWLDILVMHAARYCRFVSKSDVKHWPLIGTLATGAGTLYIERASRRDALRVVHQMADALRNGDVLAIFPEGTTSDGVDLLPFHANLLQAAVVAGVPAQPVALQFIEAGSGAVSLAPCYIGDDTLVGSIWRTLTGPRITAVVRYGAPQAADGRERRAWAAELHAEVGRLRSQDARNAL